MENFYSKRFEEFMKSHEMEEILGDTKGVFIAKYTDKYGEEIVLRELESKEEYDAWYERVGRDIEKNHEGKIRMEFGPPELKPADAEIVKVENSEDVQKPENFEKEIKKEGFIFIVSGKNDKNNPDEKFRAVAEFDTLEDAQTFQDSVGQIITDNGGEIMIGYGPSEINE